MNSHERPMCVQGDSGLVLTTDPKPRLRWTVELHERFVDAVTQLGGPDSTLGKQPHKEFSDHSMKQDERASTLELQRNNASSGMMGRSMNEYVQRHLQLRIEAQGKYMQTILEKACQTLAGENMAAPNYTNNKPMGLELNSGPPSMNFPSLQDLNIYGNTDHQLELHHQTIERSSINNAFMPSNNDTFYLSNKRPSNNSSGKSPLIWADDLRLQDLGTSSCLDDHNGHIQIDRGSGVDSGSDIYEAKPVLSGDFEKKFDVSTKMNHSAVTAGGRSSQFG
ncbi:hypothetical protein DH2020_033087 [Rehmannia glutinosa]|uniref:MYB-CC type transcription factor LHEQLE-containing domain-containing protein n=1 Tax=Rehmannia glutinosa TaxID=99300 RepID=A0ABR0VDJ8_REHGL